MSRSVRWRRPPLTLNAAADVVLLVLILCFTSLYGEPAPVGIALALASWLALLPRYAYPLTTFVIVVGLDAVRLGAFDLQQPETFTVLPIGTLVAAATLAASRRPVLAWPAGIAGAVVLLGAGLLGHNDDQLAALMFMADVVVIATAAGYLARVRREQLRRERDRAERAERTRDDEARRQVAAERVRIARELHDILAHHLTLVNAQAGVAEHLLATDPEAAAVALRGIGVHTRQALDEVQVTIGLLRQVLQRATAAGVEDDSDTARIPTPTAADLETLLASFRAAGGGLDVRRTGDPVPLAPAADLAAYRIVQESLTNARKHAPGSPVTVTITWTPDALHAEVRTRRSGSPVNGSSARGAEPGVGHGLMGMRERALAAGGSLSAGRETTGDWVVAAVLPTASGPALVRAATA